MNKVLIAAVAIILVAVAAFALVNNQAQKKESPKPAQTQTQTPKEVQNEETITLTSSGFEPETITIKPETRVVFINRSGSTAAVNSDIHPIHSLYPLLNLGNFGDGERLEVTFEESGTYTYHNHLNASQTGKIVVK